MLSLYSLAGCSCPAASPSGHGGSASAAAASYWKALCWRYPVKNLHAAFAAQLHTPESFAVEHAADSHPLSHGTLSLSTCTSTSLLVLCPRLSCGRCEKEAYCLEDWQIQNAPKDWYSSEEGQRSGYEAGKEAPEAVCLHHHPNDCPSPHHQTHPAQEQYASLLGTHCLSVYNLRVPRRA